MFFSGDTLTFSGRGRYNRRNNISSDQKEGTVLSDPAGTKRLFEDAPVGSALWTMIAPTILSQLIVLIYNMADTFYVGQTSDHYMVAGVSLILPVFNLLICIANLAGVGGGTLLSRLLGRERADEARRAACFSFYLCIACALLFSLGMGIFMDPLLRLLGAGTNTWRYAKGYAFCVIVLGALPTVFSNVAANLVRSSGLSKQAGLGIMLGGALNIVLDPLFMFVLLPRGSEVLGVGIATFLSNCAACAYFLSVLYRVRDRAPLTLNVRVGRPEGASIRAIFAVGLPAALTMLLFDVDYMVIDRLMSAHSDEALAAIGIVLKVERLPLNVGIGICQGMIPLVAYNFASKDYERMDDATRRAFLLGLLVAAVSVALYELFSPWIIRVFMREERTAALATDFLRVRELATPLMFLCFFTVHLFEAYGRGKLSLLLGVVRWAVFNIPMLLLLDHCFGMDGVIWTQVSADGLSAAFSLAVFLLWRKRAALRPTTHFSK